MGNLAFVWPYFLIMQINCSLHTPHALSALITGGKQLQLQNLAFLLCHGLSFLFKKQTNSKQRRVIVILKKMFHPESWI